MILKTDSQEKYERNNHIITQHKRKWKRKLHKPNSEH